MSAFSISFDPPIAAALRPVTAEWVEAINGDNLPWPYEVEGDVDLQFSIDGNPFGYYPWSLIGVFTDLAGNWAALRSKTVVDLGIQGYTALCAERIGGALQFYDPFDSYSGAERKPLNQLRLAGAPIPCDAVERGFLEAIAAVRQRLDKKHGRTLAID